VVAFELAGLDRLDHVEDPEVDSLHTARQDPGGVVVLILVDADPPGVVLCRRLERAEPTTARDLEQDLGALAAREFRERPS